MGIPAERAATRTKRHCCISTLWRTSTDLPPSNTSRLKVAFVLVNGCRQRCSLIHQDLPCEEPRRIVLRSSRVKIFAADTEVGNVAVMFAQKIAKIRALELRDHFRLPGLDQLLQARLFLELKDDGIVLAPLVVQSPKTGKEVNRSE